MIPAEVNLRAPTNAYDVRTITLPGFASATGTTVRVEFRKAVEEAEGVAALLVLTNSGGLAVTSDETSLNIVWTITEAQIDTLRSDLKAANLTKAQWSLKVTTPDTVTLQWFYGTYEPFPVATQ